MLVLSLVSSISLPPPQASLGLLIQRERERKVDEKPKQMEKRRENNCLARKRRRYLYMS